MSYPSPPSGPPSFFQTYPGGGSDGVGVGTGVGDRNGAEAGAQPIIAREMKPRTRSSEVSLFNLLLAYKEVISHIIS